MLMLCQPYGQADPLYAGMELANGGPVPTLGGQHFGGPAAGPAGYDAYGFDDDNFGGSGALYSGNGHMNMKSKRADGDRECESSYLVESPPLLMVSRRQPLRCYEVGRVAGRYPQFVQGPARMSVLAEEARGRGSRAQGYDLPRDVRTLPRTHDRYVQSLPSACPHLIAAQTPLATTSVKSSSNTRPTNSETLFANPSPMTSSASRSTCTAREPFKR